MTENKNEIVKKYHKYFQNTNSLLSSVSGRPFCHYLQFYGIVRSIIVKFQCMSLFFCMFFYEKENLSKERESLQKKGTCDLNCTHFVCVPCLFFTSDRSRPSTHLISFSSQSNLHSITYKCIYLNRMNILNFYKKSYFL